ncbi:hypothetical protein PCL_08374 [Purpureocillium lilacinum]|uniref:FAD-binding 8 domain-containing protein n=1 Tax=Purpureocillium lilacinum TaxID=33203 RepID=A0A2U3DS05_PURLI|nr:hypothetical protein PCL_08374 [Purpureocillium lilacinum]
MELPSLRDETTWYAIALGAVVGGSALIRTAIPPVVRQPVTRFIGTILKYILPLLVIRLATFVRLYTVFASPDGAIAWLRAHDIVRLWPLKHMLILALYWGANFSCLFIFFTNLKDAGKRAGRLSLVNLIVLYAGPHLSVLADIVGLAIPTYRRLHASVAATSFCMAAFHVVVAIINRIDPLLSTSKSSFGLIATNNCAGWKSHPFTVTSWQAGPVERMELIIAPQNGWTRHLFEKAQQRSSTNCWAFFTGPHGLAANVEDYERILVFASQFGIIPCIPYLQHIMSSLPRESPASQHSRPQHSRLEHVHICWESQRKVVPHGAEYISANHEDSPDDAPAAGSTLEKFVQGLVNGIENSRRKVGLYSPAMVKSRWVFSESVVAERRKIPFQEVLDDELKGKHKDHKLLILGMQSTNQPPVPGYHPPTPSPLLAAVR